MIGFAGIEADGLTKYYGKQRGVEDLHFEVHPGEVFGYLGPNGAGKSTTIRTLLDFIRPTRGRAEIFGLDSHDHSREIHERTGYLPGELRLYPRISCKELLEYYAHLRGGVPWRSIEALAERLDLDLHVQIRSLSHGTRQKIGIVQAFMHEPELLVLDEPTQGLDPIVQQEFHRIVSEYRKEGRTVFLSSHVMPEVERMCDRVGIIREGKLIAVEDIGDLKARAVREVEIHFAQPVRAEDFLSLRGVSSVAVEGDVLRCKVKGSADALVKQAAGHTVLTLASVEPSLEEIFLEHYGEQEA